MGLFFYFCIKALLFEKYIHQNLENPSNSPDLRPVASNNSPHNQHFFSFATLKNRIFIIQNLQFLFFMSINSQNMTIFCMIFIFKSI